ncbi:hypothetical protein BJF96_g8904 [Verticillium dahliae]|uniref:Uncharacterized protein n=1 Tax=Verticillium dahliae TaxID=27337 RepID=A0AA45AIH1_VERDA|nr:hypothetical protein BJF96_g8904 [Verticillium dahliae]
MVPEAKPASQQASKSTNQLTGRLLPPHQEAHVAV